MKFSLFKKPIQNTKPAKSVTIDDVYALITGDKYVTRTAHLRTLSGNEARQFKAAEFDYVTFSGVFVSRRESDLIKHSGLLCLDFDHVKNVKELESKLIADPHFAPQLVFVSPSGDGIKFVIAVDVERYTHLQWFEGCKNYFQQIYGLEVDKACKDVSRACFLPYDPDCYIGDEDYKPTEPLCPLDWIVAPQQQELVPDVQKTTQNVDIAAQVDNIINQCERAHIDIAPTYEEWLRLGFALASEFGLAGAGYFHRFSQLHPNYNSANTEKQYQQCCKAKGSGVTIHTLFHIAKTQGLNVAINSGDKNATTIIAVRDYLQKHTRQNWNANKELTEKVAALANDYYQILTNAYSADELQQKLDSEGCDGFTVSYENKHNIIKKNRKEYCLQDIISEELLIKMCCEKHIPLLIDVLKENFSFNFTVEELQAWIDTKPQTIFRGYYYDKTAHCFRSDYGNEYYCIENEIFYRLKNLFASCLNYQKREFKALKDSILQITQAFVQNMYLQKDMEYSDVRMGDYEDITNYKLPRNFGKANIYRFFHDLFTCTDQDIDSLIIFIASTQRVHFFGDIRCYYCLLLTGDSGIGKDSFFPSFCMGMDYMDYKANDYLYKGSLYGTTRFSNISEPAANKLMYNWISDDIEAANMVNKLDIINNPYFRIERKKQDPSLLVKRFNTTITANFKDVIFGKNYDPNAVVGRFLFAHFEYKNGWRRPDYINYYVTHNDMLRDFYKASFAWIFQNVAIDEMLLDSYKTQKIEEQKDKVFSSIYKSEEDYQICELFLDYYKRQQLENVGNVIDYKEDKWVFVENSAQLHSIFSPMRTSPSAKKVQKALALFFHNENVLYSPLVYRFGRQERMSLLVRAGMTIILR